MEKKVLKKEDLVKVVGGKTDIIGFALMENVIKKSPLFRHGHGRKH